MVGIFGPIFVCRYSSIFGLIFGRDVVRVIKSHGIELVNICGSVNSKESLSTLKSLDADLFISIAAIIFKRRFLDIPRLGTLNLHTALLPKYRGLMPSFWVLKNKEKQTGVSVFFVDEGIDSGPILVQKKFNIENLSHWDLVRMTKFLGMEAILEGIA